MTMTMNRPDAPDSAGGYEAARKAMIDGQLRTSGVSEPWALAAMARVAREDHVPPAWRAAAYVDRAIPLGDGRFLAAPLVHGRMLAEAMPTRADKTLLIGAEGGYLAALLEPLVGALDIVAPGEAAGKRRKGRYSLVVVDGAAEELPAAVLAQVAEGGRLVTGQVLRGVTRLATGRKVAGEVTLLPLAEMGIPVLPEFAAPRRWSF